MSTPPISAPAPLPPPVPQPAAPPAPGYFETAAKAVWAYVRSIFEAIAKFFGCASEPVEKPEKAILARLNEGLYSGPSLLFLFKQYFQEEEQVVVYRFEGQQLNQREPLQNEPRGWFSSAPAEKTLQQQLEETVQRGEHAVFNDPKILIPYLSDRLSQLLMKGTA